MIFRIEKHELENHPGVVRLNFGKKVDSGLGSLLGRMGSRIYQNSSMMNVMKRTRPDISITMFKGDCHALGKPPWDSGIYERKKHEHSISRLK